VSVVDDGGGVARPSASSGGGHGLVGMRERVNVHGGELTAGSAGRGWAVEATMPVRTAVTTA
jgi:signal transduction histidine kinase